jgi:hypothetical protein
MDVVVELPPNKALHMTPGRCAARRLSWPLGSVFPENAWTSTLSLQA